MMKGNKGITLIALVITIIVLLILAGVAIAMLSGDNSILKNAQTAREESTKGALEEATKIAVGNIMTDNLGWPSNVDGTKLVTEINKVSSDLAATVDSTFTKTTVVKIDATVKSGVTESTQTVYVSLTNGAVYNKAADVASMS